MLQWLSQPHQSRPDQPPYPLRNPYHGKLIMQYKTIIYELMQQQPAEFARLESSNTLISTLETQASRLRDLHLAIVEQLRQNRPASAEFQLKSEAMEIALQQFQETLVEQATDEHAKPLSLDAAMEFLKSQPKRGQA